MALVKKHGLHGDVTGWTRKTYDVYGAADESLSRPLLLRIESIALTNGEIQVFDDAGLALAEEIGSALERDFGLAEAVIVRRAAP